MLIDTFAPKRLLNNGQWASYSSKLERYSPDYMKRICATREGSLLRFWKSAEPLWAAAEKESPIGYEMDEETLRTIFLGCIAVHAELYGASADEVRFVGEQIETGYPWLQ